MLEYSIREKNREPLVDVEYSYLLSKDEETELVKFSVIKLKEDEEIKYTEKVYETYICDNISLQTVNLYGEENGKLKIEHPRNKEIDKEILDYFLEKTCGYPNNKRRRNAYNQKNFCKTTERVFVGGKK